jgi:hypothetical protein
MLAATFLLQQHEAGITLARVHPRLDFGGGGALQVALLHPCSFLYPEIQRSRLDAQCEGNA